MKPTDDHTAEKLNPEIEPSLERLREDIQRAVASYNDAINAANPIGASLSSVVREVQDQWSSFAAAVKPIADSWSSTASEIKAALEGANRFFSEMAQEWAAAQLSLQKAMQEATPRIRKALEGADKLGTSGWTLPMSMTVFEMQWIEDLPPVDMDVHFMEYYAARNDSDLHDLEQRLGEIKALEEFRPLLAQCFGAYRRGEFAITIAPLVSLFERTLRSLCPSKHFYSAKVTDFVGEQYDNVKQNAEDSIEVYLWMSLFAFVRWFYHHYGPGQANATRPFRHGIPHGTQVPPNERIEALRLFHALSTATTLYKS